MTEPAGTPASLSVDRRAGTRVVEWIVDHPRGILAAIVGVTAAFGVAATSVRLDSSVEALLPSGHPALLQDRQVKEEFDSREMVLLGVIHPDGVFNSGTLASDVRQVPGTGKWRPHMDVDAEELGQPAIRATWYRRDWAFEVVVVPRFELSRLPVIPGRWWPVDAFGAGVRGASAPPRHGVPGFPDGRVAVGARVTGTVAGTEASLSVYRGPGSLPPLVPEVVLGTGPTAGDIVISRIARARTAFGFDLVRTFGSYGLRAEAATCMTPDRQAVRPEVEDPFFRYLVGVDTRMGGVVGSGDLLLILEVTGDQPLVDREEEWAASDLNHPFRTALFGTARLDLGDFSLLELRGVKDVDQDDWAIQIRPSWSPRDGLELEASIDLFGGPDDSFFGPFRDNGRVHATARWSW